VCRFRVNASVRVMLRLSFSDRDGIRLPDVELVEFYVGILTYSHSHIRHVVCRFSSLVNIGIDGDSDTVSAILSQFRNIAFACFFTGNRYCRHFCVKSVKIGVYFFSTIKYTSRRLLKSVSCL